MATIPSERDTLWRSHDAKYAPDRKTPEGYEMNYETGHDPLLEAATGLSTGFIELDRITSGLQPGDLIIVAARPGMGKTSFSLNIARHVGLVLEKPVAIFGMGYRVQQLMMRMLASDSGINKQVLHCGEFEINEWSKFASSIDKLNAAPIFFDGSTALDVMEIRSRAQRFMQEKSELVLIVIDFLQLMCSRDKFSEITQALNQLAKDLHVPIIVLSQLDRRLERRQDKRPLLSDLGAMEQNADVVLFLYREECYTDDPKNIGTAELIVAKNRNGETGIIPFVFVKENGQFENPAATYDAKQDLHFEAVKQMVIETCTPSISLVQRTFRINYSRAANMLEAMEGDVVTPKDERGMRRMLTGETKGRDESEIISSPDWVDSGMRSFDSVFFNELAKLDALVKVNECSSVLMPPRDGFRPRLSELHDAGMISDDFVRISREFVVALAMRSGGRYQFEMDFIVGPCAVESHSKGRSGRKQLQIEFDACPLGGRFHRDWGVSIGLNFDFRNEHGIITECVNEYEAFEEKVNCDHGLFDATFGSLGGYDGSTASIKEPVNAEKVCQTPVHITQHSLFFGKRLTPDAITAMGSLDDFVDECIRVFDLICDAGYYNHSYDASEKPLYQIQ